VLEQALSDESDDVVAERAGGVDAGQLGADPAGEAPDPELDCCRIGSHEVMPFSWDG
jgi:hypothetical protein